MMTSQIGLVVVVTSQNGFRILMTPDQIDNINVDSHIGKNQTLVSLFYDFMRKSRLRTVDLGSGTSENVYLWISSIELVAGYCGHIIRRAVERRRWKRLDCDHRYCIFDDISGPMITSRELVKMRQMVIARMLL